MLTGLNPLFNNEEKIILLQSLSYEFQFFKIVLNFYSKLKNKVEIIILVSWIIWIFDQSFISILFFIKKSFSSSLLFSTYDINGK